MKTLLLLLTVHYVADFLIQTDWMALGKSKAWKPLLAHTSLYSLCFLAFGWQFVLVTFVLHTATDYCTSRWGGANFFFVRQALDGCDPPLTWEWRFVPTLRGKFFNIIGFDQLVHTWCLCLTYLWLKG